MALKDISIGQYLQGYSFLHRMDPRYKLVLTVAYIVMLFIVSHPLGYLVVVGFLFAAFLVARVPFRLLRKSIKPILPIVIFTAVLNLFFITGSGDPLFSFGFLHIYLDGVTLAVTMAIRIVCLIAGTSLLTYTTTPIALTDALEKLLGPLKKLHFPAHELAMMMTTALRFIPTLVEETDKIMSAQKARGADMESGGLMQRVKALIPVLIPLFVSAFRRADELALAMECRCYRGGEGRTRLKELKAGYRDLVACLIVIACFGAIISINLLLPPLF